MPNFTLLAPAHHTASYVNLDNCALLIPTLDKGSRIIGDDGIDFYVAMTADDVAKLHPGFRCLAPAPEYDCKMVFVRKDAVNAINPFKNPDAGCTVVLSGGKRIRVSPVKTADIVQLLT